MGKQNLTSTQSTACSHRVRLATIHDFQPFLDILTWKRHHCAQGHAHGPHTAFPNAQWSSWNGKTIDYRGCPEVTYVWEYNFVRRGKIYTRALFICEPCAKSVCRRHELLFPPRSVADSIWA